MEILGIEMKDFIEKLAVANRDVSGTVSLGTIFRVCFYQIQILLDFPMIDNPHFEVVIGLPSLKTLHACIDLRT